MVELSAVEVRVVGSLMEKEVTTPDAYPLSLNALVNACNQKSSREPVMELTEADVRSALYELENKGLVRTLADARVSKYENRTRDQWNLRRDEFAVICLLLLRGAQTPAELRARAERLFAFDDTQAVQATLERLAGRAAEEGVGPMTVLLPRQPGSREARWLHLLGGLVDAAVVSAVAPQRAASDSGLAERVEMLEGRVEALEEKLRTLLG